MPVSLVLDIVADFLHSSATLHPIPEPTMKSAALLLPAVAHAFVARDAGTGCCFHLTATGGPGGRVDQLFDGQNRIGQTGLPEGQYCINGNGGLTDSNGRGCIITPPTGQWQCDAGATPTPGFSVGSDGKLAMNGSTTFYGAPTGNNGGWNIYDKPLNGEPKTTEVTLLTDNCQATKQPPPAPAPPKSACPAELPAKIQDFEFPVSCKTFPPPVRTGLTFHSISSSPSTPRIQTSSTAHLTTAPLEAASRPSSTSTFPHPPRLVKSEHAHAVHSDVVTGQDMQPEVPLPGTEEPGDIGI